MGIARFTILAGPSGQTMDDASKYLEQTSQTLFIIDENKNQYLHQDDPISPAPRSLGFAVLAVEENGITKLVVPP